MPNRIGKRAVFLHAEPDEDVPIGDTLEVIRESGFDPSALVEVGENHRMTDPQSWASLVDAIERAVSKRANDSVESQTGDSIR